MKRFKIEGSKLLKFYGQDVLLERVFSEIEAELKTQGLVVCQYIVNGLSLTEKDENRFAKYFISEVISLEYLTEEEAKLTSGVIDGWVSAIPELQDGSEFLGNKIRAGNHQGYLRDLKDIVENCEYLSSSLKLFLNEISNASEVKTLIDDVESKTLATLREIMKNVETKNMMQLSWSLEYDLVHCLEIWKDILLRFKEGHVAGRIENKNQSDLVRGRTTH